MNEYETTTAVLYEVLYERDNQDEKWGEQNHNLSVWGDILSEKVGEAAKARNNARFGSGSISDIKKELIQVAAVAVAMVECIDRGKYPSVTKE